MSFFNRFNLETQCAMFASCVFIFFFTSSVFSLAKADPVFSGGDSGYSAESGGTEDVSVDDSVFVPCPDNQSGPDAGGPDTYGSPHALGPDEIPPASFFSNWWEKINKFFKSMLDLIKV
jgi:hypothetical protein